MQKLSSIKFIVLIASFLSLLSIQPVLSQSQAVDRNILDSIQLIPETLSRIHGDYVEEVDNHELIQAAVDGMLRSLDPHSGYITPEEMIANQEQTTGEFGGLGMTVTTEDGFIKIISPIDDTPAYRAGLQAGDFIIEINGETVLDKSLQDGVELLRGPPGSEVTLTIKREELEPFMVTLTREIIETEAATVRVEGNVIVARVKTFNQQSVPNLEEGFAEINDLHNGGDDLLGVVVDLRNNPGGTLDAAIGVTDLFLNEGVIVSVRNRESRQSVYEAHEGDIVNGKPLVVLINAGSASASEIFAGAMQDLNRGVLIGTKSFGKGSVQSIFDLDRELNNSGERKYGGIRLTIAKYYTPSGRSIQGNGITPDITLPFQTPEDVSEEPDQFVFTESKYGNSLQNDGLQNEESNIERLAEINKIISDIRKTDNQLGFAIDFINGVNALN